MGESGKTPTLNQVTCADGGTLRELVKEPWGQLTLRTIKPGCKVGRHKHPNTREWFTMVQGEVIVMLRYKGFSEPTRYHISSEHLSLLNIPPGTWHEVENKSDEEAVLLFWSSEWYENQEKE